MIISRGHSFKFQRFILAFSSVIYRRFWAEEFNIYDNVQVVQVEY